MSLEWLKKMALLLYFDKTSILVIKYQLLALNLLALPPTQSGYFMLVNLAALKKPGL
jgi:hypothetical protein